MGILGNLLCEVSYVFVCAEQGSITLRVQVPNTLLNIELRNYYPKPKYLIIGSFGPLG